MLKTALKLMANKELHCLKKLKLCRFWNHFSARNDGKQNPETSYTNKYQKHIACSYGYKLVCVDDTFRKPVKSYLGKDAVYNFINSMTEESKYCSEVMKKHFNKELVMTKGTMKILRALLNAGSVIMVLVILMLK